MRIEMTKNEVEEIIGIIDERLRELSSEIHHARVSTYNDLLRQRKQVLVEILKRLQQQLN